jgi:hypothetical protein
MNSKKRLDPGPLILAYVGTGQRDKALDEVERAYTEHSPIIASMGVDPIYDPLRDQPRFQELLKKVDLPNRK